MTLSARGSDRPMLPVHAWDHPKPPRPGQWSAPAMWARPSPWAAGAVGLAPEHGALARRLAGHLLLAALPLLAISAHVFNLVPMHLTAGLVVIPLLVVIVVASLWHPLEQDRMLLRAAIVGAIATAVYDSIRIDTVYLLGWWGDFIPRIGAWILNTDDPVTGLVEQPGTAEVLVGYIWRYAGDGAGIGVWFYVLAAALRLRDRSRGITIGAAVAFAVAPVWAGLIATVGLAPRAGELMFPLTPRTLALSLLGHLIFGLVLGIGAARADRLDRLWPWRRPPIPGLDAVLDWLEDAAPAPDRAPDRGAGRPARRLPGGGWSAAVGTASPSLAARPGEMTHLLPPTIEPRTGRAEVTELVAPIRDALPPAAPRATPTPVPPVGALPHSAGAGTARPDRSRCGPASGPIPYPSGPRAPVSGPVSGPISGPVRMPASPPAHLPVRHPHPPAQRPDQRPDPRATSRSGHSDGPPVAWGRLSQLPSAAGTEATEASATVASAAEGQR